MLACLLFLIGSDKVPLQRPRLDSGLSEFLRGSGRGREAFDLESFTLGGFSDSGKGCRLAGTGDSFKRHHLIAVR